MQESAKQEVVVLSGDPQDDSIDVRALWRVLKKWRWLIITLPCICAVIGMLISFQLPPVYQATARILIEKGSSNILSFQEVFEVNSADKDYYQTQLNILQSRSLAESVIRTLQLEKHLQEDVLRQPRAILRQYVKEIQKFLGLQASASALSDSSPASAEVEMLLTHFTGKMKISPVSNSRLIDIQARFSDPQLVAPIANSLVAAYMELHLENKLAASKKAVHWLEKELTEAKKKVLNSERALQDNNQEHDILAVEERQNLGVQQLAELNTALNQARIERMAIEVKYRQVKNLTSESAGKIPQVTNDPLIQQLKLRVFKLETELSEILKKFRTQHPNVIALQSQIDSVREQMNGAIQQIFLSISTEYTMAFVREEELQKLVEAQKQEMQKLSRQTIENSVLRREVESNRRIYESLLQRVKETSVTERLESNSIQMIEQAREPNSPLGPRKSRNTVLALILGLAAGLGLAFVGETLNNKISIPEEFENILNLQFLGLIPKIGPKEIQLRDRKQALDTIIATITLFMPQSPASEAYRGLRTNIQFSFLKQKNILLITSTEPSEGKSTIVSNLGITLAQNGQKTLIIDCDFRKPTIAKIFHLAEDQPGFADMIAGEQGSEKTGYPTELPNLHIIPCGSIPPNPSELLGSPAASRIIESFTTEYDVILLDSPPITAVTDSLILTRLVTGVMLVVRAGQSKREVIRYAGAQLQNAGAHIIGGVLNAADLRKNASYYGYQYSQYYQREKGAKK
ncbi:MAG: polysaccharide biosynthesis tyrosine autokinase [bacterium]|nr:polysaccharide biosynthesis tyrosine autokinase [bacterium]